VLTRAGEAPEVVLKAAFGWYWGPIKDDSVAVGGASDSDTAVGMMRDCALARPVC
jgi:hypothetical protein